MSKRGKFPCCAFVAASTAMQRGISSMNMGPNIHIFRPKSYTPELGRMVHLDCIVLPRVRLPGISRQRLRQGAAGQGAAKGENMAGPQIPQDLRAGIVAAAAGNVIE